MKKNAGKNFNQTAKQKTESYEEKGARIAAELKSFGINVSQPSFPAPGKSK